MTKRPRKTDEMEYEKSTKGMIRDNTVVCPAHGEVCRIIDNLEDRFNGLKNGVNEAKQTSAMATQRVESRVSIKIFLSSLSFLAVVLAFFGGLLFNIVDTVADIDKTVSVHESEKQSISREVVALSARLEKIIAQAGLAKEREVLVATIQKNVLLEISELKANIEKLDVRIASLSKNIVDTTEDNRILRDLLNKILEGQDLKLEKEK